MLFVMAEETTGAQESTSFVTSGSESECDDEPLSILDVLKAPSVAKQNT